MNVDPAGDAVHVGPGAASDLDARAGRNFDLDRLRAKAEDIDREVADVRALDTNAVGRAGDLQLRIFPAREDGAAGSA